MQARKKRHIDLNQNVIDILKRGTSTQATDRGCLEWQRATVDGYGVIGLKKDKKPFTVFAHRVSWVIANRMQVPDDLVIAHKCDNRKCVNPEHLECVPQSKNVNDAFDRGGLQAYKGSGSWSMKLSASKVCNLRKLHNEEGLSVRYLARQLCIPYETVRRAIIGMTWRNVA